MIDCKIQVFEDEGLLHIIIANWIDHDDKEEILQIIDRQKNIDDIKSLERVTKEEHSGILKINNIVTNILHAPGNSYVNNIDDDCFTAAITLNIKKLQHGA